MKENKNKTFNNNKPKDIRNNGKNFTGTELGSATWVSLDGHSGSDGYITQDYTDDKKEESEFSTRGAPWGLEPSLKARCEEVGIDFDEFISSLKNNTPDGELSNKFNVTENTITNLREYFEQKGLDTTMGQD